MSYQRGKRNTTPGTSLIKIEGVDDTKAAKYVSLLIRKLAWVTDRLTASISERRSLSFIARKKKSEDQRSESFGAKSPGHMVCFHERAPADLRTEDYL